MRSLFLVLAVLFQISAAMAAQVKMAIITSDIDAEIRDFYMITNNKNEIDSVRYVTYLSSGQILEDETTPAETVIADGTVVVERQGRDVVRLEVEKDFSVKEGGTIRMNYLYNGITGTRRAYQLKLIKIGDTFKLQDLEGKPVNNFFVVGNRSRVAGVIGVKEIRSSFKP